MAVCTAGDGLCIPRKQGPSPAVKERYQILFDLTTFDKCFPGPPIKIEYSTQQSLDGTSDSGIPAHGVLSDPLKVFTYNVDDLPLVEKQAVNSGR